MAQRLNRAENVIGLDLRPAIKCPLACEDASRTYPYIAHSSSAGLQTGCTGGVHAARVRVRAGGPHDSRPGGRRYLYTDKL